MIAPDLSRYTVCVGSTPGASPFSAAARAVSSARRRASSAAASSRSSEAVRRPPRFFLIGSDGAGEASDSWMAGSVEAEGFCQFAFVARNDFGPSATTGGWPMIRMINDVYYTYGRTAPHLEHLPLHLPDYSILQTHPHQRPQPLRHHQPSSRPCASSSCASVLSVRGWRPLSDRSCTWIKVSRGLAGQGRGRHTLLRGRL